VDLQGVLATLLDHGTALTHGLRLGLAAHPRWAAFILWVKEHHSLQTATRTLGLPLPMILNRTGKPTVIRQNGYHPR